MPSRSTDAADVVRVVSAHPLGALAGELVCAASSAGWPVRLVESVCDDIAAALASVPDDGALVVLVLAVEDAFPELDWLAESVWDVEQTDLLLAEVAARTEALAARVRAFLVRRRSRYVVVPPVFEPAALPVASRQVALRIARLSARVTDAVVDALADVPDGSVLDVDRALETLPRLQWRGHAGLAAGGAALSQEAASLVAHAVVPRLRLAWQAKVLVTDLDDTLWRGVLSEDGPDGVGAHRTEAEMVHRTWQRLLLCARSYGFVLAVVSKNSIGAFDVFDDAELRTRAGLLVSPDDFAAVSTAWTPKSGQLADISAALDLPLDVFVVVDDNPVELAEIASALPELQTLAFPSDPSGWPAFCRSLQESTATSDATLTDEDRDRARLYALRYRSEVARASARSFDDFLASLDMRLDVEPVRSPGASSRAQQLLNRANRFHLTGRRYDEGTWTELLADPRRAAFTARLVDGYGDHGICAVVVAESDAGSTSVSELAMSCRVLNRTLESALLNWLATRTAGELTASFRRTGRNDAVLDALLGNGFAVVTDDEATVLLRLADRDRLDAASRYAKVVATDS